MFAVIELSRKNCPLGLVEFRDRRLELIVFLPGRWKVLRSSCSALLLQLQCDVVAAGPMTGAGAAIGEAGRHWRRKKWDCRRGGGWNLADVVSASAVALACFLMPSSAATLFEARLAFVQLGWSELSF